MIFTRYFDKKEYTKTKRVSFGDGGLSVFHRGCMCKLYFVPWKRFVGKLCKSINLPEDTRQHFLKLRNIPADIDIKSLENIINPPVVMGDI